MTKKVRIENADTSDFVVVVETWGCDANGLPATLRNRETLQHPTAMLEGVIYDSQCLIIREIRGSDV